MHDNYDLDQMMELVQERKFRALREILTALLSMREEWRHANCS